MFKATPNPPNTDPFSATLDAKKLREAADRALDYYLKPTPITCVPPRTKP